MPLYDAELNRVANEISASAMVAYAHSAAPTNADADNGRINSTGIAMTAGNWSAASGGDVQYDADVQFGVLDASNQQVVTHWSVFRGAAAVAFGSLASPITVVAGGTFQINSGTIRLLGSTT